MEGWGGGTGGTTCRDCNLSSHKKPCSECGRMRKQADFDSDQLIRLGSTCRDFVHCSGGGGTIGVYGGGDYVTTEKSLRRVLSGARKCNVCQNDRGWEDFPPSQRDRGDRRCWTCIAARG